MYACMYRLGRCSSPSRSHIEHMHACMCTYTCPLPAGGEISYSITVEIEGVAVIVTPAAARNAVAAPAVARAKPSGPEATPATCVYACWHVYMHPCIYMYQGKAEWAREATAARQGSQIGPGLVSYEGRTWGPCGLVSLTIWARDPGSRVQGPMIRERGDDTTTAVVGASDVTHDAHGGGADGHRDVVGRHANLPGNELANAPPRRLRIGGDVTRSHHLNPQLGHTDDRRAGSGGWD